MNQGIVKQLNSGQVIECTCSQECMKVGNNACTFPRQCLLPVNHGDRCSAYPQDKTVWFIENETDSKQF